MARPPDRSRFFPRNEWPKDRRRPISVWQPRDSERGTTGGAPKRALPTAKTPVRARVKYIGTLSKRREATLADCITLKPGETLSCEAALEDAYAIPAFRKIKVQYAAMHVDPLESPGLEYLTSNTVEIDT